MKIVMMEKLLKKNDDAADENREVLAERGLYMVNVMASPGAGKTSVIMRLLGALKYRGIDAAVIEGDIASEIDSERIEAQGYAAVQINSGGACHLDAPAVAKALHETALRGGIIFVENIGNLVCPRSFDLGEDLRLVVASTAEGDDKTRKYITMFEVADAVVLNKIDLTEIIGFRRDFFADGLGMINPGARIFPTDCRSGAGIGELADYMAGKYREKISPSQSNGNAGKSRASARFE